ncbi:MAG: CD3324 family protein [Bilophila wadsworthia]
MSYTNADRILPRELLDAIQQYADGVYLYIPRKAERKRAWGEATDSRRERLARNRELYEKHLGGAPVHKLAEEYYLSAKTLKSCLHAAGMTDSATGPRLRRFFV